MIKRRLSVSKWVVVFAVLILFLIGWGEYAIEGLRTLPSWKGDAILFSLLAVGIAVAVFLHPRLSRRLARLLKSDDWARHVSSLLLLGLVMSLPWAAGDSVSPGGMQTRST